MARIAASAEGPGRFLKEHRDEIVAALSSRDLVPRIWTGSATRMTEVPTASVALVVTSPPYPMIARWDAQFARALGLSETAWRADPRAFDLAHGVLDPIWKECARALMPGGIIAVNIGDATRSLNGSFKCFPNHVRVAVALGKLGLEPLVPILWKKPTNKPNAFLGSGFLPPNAYITLDCEPILIYRKPGTRSFPRGDLLRYASQFSKAERDQWFSQVWEIRGAPQGKTTTPFPESIPERLVRMFSCLADTVLDPFAGSGTTLRVAQRWGRRAWGYELDAGLADKISLGLHAWSVEEVVQQLLSTYAVAIPREGGRKSR